MAELNGIHEMDGRAIAYRLFEPVDGGWLQYDSFEQQVKIRDDMTVGRRDHVVGTCSLVFDLFFLDIPDLFAVEFCIGKQHPVSLDTYQEVGRGFRIGVVSPGCPLLDSVQSNAPLFVVKQILAFGASFSF
ncbi:hypothetical protein KZY59_04900 [Prevotella buccae]|uniref:hypothetical protein n=1 Tax=Segatella buccae TaxID=28126 RepID=UPI0012DE463E|nr:hypothetical protein [Segatella buccae]MBW4870889.1 hypothetical protein [Segatella buccae]